ncbi:MAG: ABC transporter ATP-binding protein [Candidatus Tectomicrobia bacterium]|uniref:ABC transporter ATP-binding protein n=1 Tax=Tectimicrobiota bacterium TaxID=2528274 RepID=A0A932MMQ8_UNCTE|nr:ABC transporter ATP-binding protein [Candidatus Tectomicrobia bacterium]
MILRVENINTFYGASHILQDVSLAVERGEVVCLLGRNGVGKTTTLRSVIGLAPPRSGRVVFMERDIAGLAPYHIARRGVGYVPDDRRVFAELSAEENLELARRSAGSREGAWTLEKVLDLLPALRPLISRRGSHLSGGEQKMLSIGRALMTNPSLLLLDEPSEGLSPIVVRSLVEIIRTIREEKVTILMADQNLRFSRLVASRAYILEKGAVQHAGTLEEIYADEQVVRRYLAI